MRSFLGVNALRKYPHAATAQPLKYPLTIKQPIHRIEGVKKKGTAAARQTPIPPDIILPAAACDLTNRPQVKSPAKCAIIATSM